MSNQPRCSEMLDGIDLNELFYLFDGFVELARFEIAPT
jgi:hypothetical protein